MALPNQEALELLIKEFSTTFTNLKNLDFKHLSVKDVLTLVGMAYTAAKSVYMVWQVYSAFKDYGISRMMRPNLVEKYGKWAVITGCTSGVGEAYMTELASCGMNIILLARDPEKRRTLAMFLEEKYKVKTHIMDIDFSVCTEVYGQIEAELGDKEIGIVVHSVATEEAAPQDFLEVDPMNIHEIIHGNILGATLSTRMILPQMAERGRGAIVFIGSAASQMAMPQLTVYNATKAYLESLSRSMRAEYKDQGVTIQCLMPFLVAGANPNVPAMENPNLLMPSSSSYAHQALGTLGWSDETEGCLSHKIQSWVAHILPGFVSSWIMSGITTILRHSANRKMGKDPSAGGGLSFFDPSIGGGAPSLLGFLGNSG